MNSAKRILAIIVIFNVLLVPATPVMTLLLYLGGNLSDEAALAGLVATLVALGFVSVKIAHMVFPDRKQADERAHGSAPGSPGAIPAEDFDMLLAARTDTARLRRIATTLPVEADRALLRELASRADGVLFRAAEDPDVLRGARNLLSYRLPKLVDLASALEPTPDARPDAARREKVRSVMNAALRSISDDARSRTRVDEIRIDTDLKIMQVELQRHQQFRSVGN